MNTDVPLIVMPDARIAMWAPVAWYLRPLAWARLITRKPLVILTRDAVLVCNPAQVDRVAQIMRDDGFTVVVGVPRSKQAADRPRWAKSPDPHKFGGPKVERPNLRPVPGDKQ